MAHLPSNSGIYHDTTVCELQLEDDPVSDDSSLSFESFPGEIEEVYSLNEYREMGGDRMPQPSFIAYRGGNWSPFTLTLIFRAGKRQGDTLSKQVGQRVFPSLINDVQLNQLLVDMEKKVRWCQALAFPLERALGETEAARITSYRASGPTDATTKAINSLRRNDPPIVLVVFGSWWVQRAYVKNVSVKWTGPWHPVTVRPYGAEVSITFQPIKPEYPTWKSIRSQGGLGGYNVVTGAVQ